MWLRNDEHSIWNQISSMLWNDTVFRMTNEIRRWRAKGSEKDVSCNHAIAQFIDQGYVATQLLSIRKLNDRSTNVISIHRLLDDIQENSHVLTREFYVSGNGLPFDPLPARKRFIADTFAHKKDGEAFTWFEPQGKDSFLSSELAHEQFDQLMGTKSRKRCRDDRIDVKIVHSLKSKLGVCRALENVASKFVAHAADATSRDKLKRRDRRVTLQRIEESQRVLCRVAAYISGPLLYIGSTDLIPTPQYDHFKDIDKPWVRSTEIPALHAYWKHRVEEVEMGVRGDLSAPLRVAL